MAHPFIFESTFEQGTNAEWDSESDTGSLLDFPHYSELARSPYRSSAPYRGAYCARIKLGDTNDHTLTEGDIDIADAGTAYFRWYMNILPDIHNTTADDVFAILELQQAGGTVEMAIGFSYTAATDLLVIGAGDGTAPDTFSTIAFPTDRWVCVEVLSTVSTTDAGAITVWVDGVQHVALTSLDQAAAVGTGVFGTQNTLSTTVGTILLDDFVMDDARLYPNIERFPDTLTITKSGHLFVGPGWLSSAALLTTTADGQANFWDTDTADVLEQQGSELELDIDTHTSFEGPLYFQRGCYVQLTGTSPRVQCMVVANNNTPGIVGCLSYSENGIRNRGRKWKSQIYKT